MSQAQEQLKSPPKREAGTVLVEMTHPKRKYRPIPNRLNQYEAPRPALVRSPNPIARIASFIKWGKQKPENSLASAN